MIPQKDRIEAAIRHIQTSADVDPWAMELAVEALKAQMDGDTISRRAAIDALMEILDRPNHAEFLYTDEICRALGQLPSAQPEIIRCENCTKCQIDTVFHDYWCDGRKVWKNHYCGYAERRTNETD